jgi:Terpene synthase family 2, C-terminal metal binding
MSTGCPLGVDQIIVPTFEFPWPGSCHPEVNDTEKCMMEWGKANDLFPDADYQARAARARYGFLAARCYPRADRALLQAAADYFLWFFLADDLFVDRVETASASTIANLTAMIDVLDYNRPHAQPVYGESAWLDVCRRLRACLSTEHFERFATGMRMWASTAGLQILNHLQQRPIEMSHYETIRRHTSGMNPCLALSDAANAGPVTPGEYHHPAVHDLRTHANNVVCWSNDIQSLIVEARQPGQFRNMVTIYAAQGHTLQEAVDITAGRVCAEIDSFASLAAQVEENASDRLRGYLTGMRDWMRGYQDWFDHDTERYAAARAGHEADDRDRRLPTASPATSPRSSSAEPGRP